MPHLDSNTGLISGFIEETGKDLDELQDRLGWVDQSDQEKTIKELVRAVIYLCDEIKCLRERVCDLTPKGNI